MNQIAHSLENDLKPHDPIDGVRNNYLIQVFERRGDGYGTSAGPFFYEIIQRCGMMDSGKRIFALFESIERSKQNDTLPSRGKVGSRNTKPSF